MTADFGILAIQSETVMPFKMLRGETCDYWDHFHSRFQQKTQFSLHLILLLFSKKVKISHLRFVFSVATVYLWLLVFH